MPWNNNSNNKEEGVWCLGVGEEAFQLLVGQLVEDLADVEWLPDGEQLVDGLDGVGLGGPDAEGAVRNLEEEPLHLRDTVLEERGVDREHDGLHQGVFLDQSHHAVDVLAGVPNNNTLYLGSFKDRYTISQDSIVCVLIIFSRFFLCV